MSVPRLRLGSSASLIFVISLILTATRVSATGNAETNKVSSANSPRGRSRDEQGFLCAWRAVDEEGRRFREVSPGCRYSATGGPGGDRGFSLGRFLRPHRDRLPSHATLRFGRAPTPLAFCQLESGFAGMAGIIRLMSPEQPIASPSIGNRVGLRRIAARISTIIRALNACRLIIESNEKIA